MKTPTPLPPPFYLSPLVPLPLQMWFGFWDMFAAQAINAVSIAALHSQFAPISIVDSISRMGGVTPAVYNEWKPNAV